jgi:transketolase
MNTRSELKNEKIATRTAYGKTLLELGRTNPDIVVFDADLSCSTQTKFFAKEFPERFFNMGIAESNMLATAAGIALAGKIPIVSSFAMFATGRAWEQLRNSIAHNQANVKICATHSGITVGEDGATHQIIEDLAITRVIPGLIVLVPADAVEAEQMLKKIVEINGPVYLRLGRSALPIVHDDSYKFEIGKAKVLREGSDLSLVACGVTVSIALEAAQELSSTYGIELEVINSSSIKPLDSKTICDSVSKTGRIISVEEHNVIGGLGDAIASEVLSQLGERSVSFKKIGIEDCFGQSGKAEDLLVHYGLSVENIINLVRSMI